MIIVKFKRQKQKYIALINAKNKKEAKQKLYEYAGIDIKIKSIRNKYSMENKIIIN